jgi:hypothetical protein
VRNLPRRPSPPPPRERRLDAVDRRADNIPEEEQQDPDRDGAQEGAQANACPRQPPHGQSDEDRYPRDQSERDDLPLRH